MNRLTAANGLSLFCLAFAAVSSAACGGSAPEPAATADTARTSTSYEEARARLETLAYGRLVIEQTDDVRDLITRGQTEAASAVEETVEIARLFDHVIRENGEPWRARCLVGIAAANRALAVLIRGLEYQMPRDVEGQLRALVTAGAVHEAELAEEEIQASIAAALEDRARPLDCNEGVALRGALSALRDWPDPEMNVDALHERLDELPECL